MRGRRAPRTDEGGYTLVELLVVLVLFGVISSVVTASGIRALQVQRRLVDTNEVLVHTKEALTRLARAIRAADPIVLAEDQRLRIKRVMNGTTYDTTFSVVTDGGVPRLVSDESTTTGGVTTPIVRRVVLDRLVSASDPVFGYADASGALLAPTSSEPNTYLPTEVRAVAIHLRVRRVSGAPFDVRDTVDVRNSD